MTSILARAAGIAALTLATSAFANPSLERFGLTDVQATAECVTAQMPASVNKEVALAYWGPAAVTNGQCMQPRRGISSADITLARQAFLGALSKCTRQHRSSDTDPWTQRVGYAVAVFAAAGVQDWISSESLLDRLVNQTIQCESPR